MWKKWIKDPSFGRFCNPVFPKKNVITNVFLISNKKYQVFKRKNISSFVMWISPEAPRRSSTAEWPTAGVFVRWKGVGIRSSHEMFGFWMFFGMKLCSFVSFGPRFLTDLILIKKFGQMMANSPTLLGVILPVKHGSTNVRGIQQR